MKPIGLTRAEEAAEQPDEPRVVVRAEPGRPRCEAAVPPDGQRCVAEATTILCWPDGDRSSACADCALRLQQLAESHRTVLRAAPIEKP